MNHFFPHSLYDTYLISQACGPLWSYECGSSYYSTGICSRVNSSFKFSRTIAPAFQSKTKELILYYVSVVLTDNDFGVVLRWNYSRPYSISIFFPFRMWNLYGHHDCSGWLQLHLPMVWSAGLSHQHPAEVLHWTGTNSGVCMLKKDFAHWRCCM